MPTSNNAADGGKVTNGADAIKAMVAYLVEYEMPMHAFMECTQKMYMRAAIIKCKGNMSQAAILVGIHRNTVHRILTSEEKRDAIDRAKSGKGI